MSRCVKSFLYFSDDSTNDQKIVRSNLKKCEISNIVQNVMYLIRVEVRINSLVYLFCRPPRKVTRYMCPIVSMYQLKLQNVIKRQNKQWVCAFSLSVLFFIYICNVLRENLIISISRSTIQVSFHNGRRFLEHQNNIIINNIL